MTDLPELLTTRQVAERLGITPAGWRGQVAKGAVPPADGWLDGRTPYWLPATVEAYVARRRPAHRPAR